MKKTILGLFIATGALLSGCSAKTTDRIEFDANETVYSLDTRTGICYSSVGVFAGVNIFKTNVEGIGMTQVPCIDEVLDLIDQDKVNTVKNDTTKQLVLN